VNITKHKNTLCEQNAELLNILKQMGYEYIVTSVLQRAKIKVFLYLMKYNAMMVYGGVQVQLSHS
jgi:hypothetical protein